jgi:hypothetical protein
MNRLLLFGALAASLLVPAGLVGVAVAAIAAPPARLSPDEVRPPTEFEKADLVAIEHELEALDRTSTPGSSGQIMEARRIAREARTWAVRFEAEPEWEELAVATSSLAALIADSLENPAAFSPDAHDLAFARVHRALDALPDDPIRLKGS